MAEPLRRILYLEDDSLIAELALIGLQDMGGFTVLHCSCGQDAIDAAVGFEPQLLLFDVMLPNMDGPQTFGHINGLPTCSDVPVIFMTAKAQKHQVQAYMDLGACGVIPKPFDPLTLCDQIQTLWSTARPVGSENARGRAAQTLDALTADEHAHGLQTQVAIPARPVT